MKMEKICEGCNIGKRKFFDKLIPHHDQYYHRECLEDLLELKESDDIVKEVEKERNKQKAEFAAGKARKNFSQIKFKLESELEALLEIDYANPAQKRTRLFFGKEGNETIYSRDYLESSKSNFVHLKILPSKKQHSTQWVKEGTQDVGDNFEAGYTVEILLRDAEPLLRKYLIDILNSFGFGCLPAARTLHGHLDDPYPTEDRAKEILKEIINKV